MSMSKSPDELMLAKRGYILDQLIGEGSYAKVYTADYSDPKNPEKKQRLACKLINGSQAPKDFIVKFFPREVEIMSRVTHPYVIRVHSILQRKNKYFLFMQYCENGDLLDFIRNNGAVDETQSRQWYSQLVRGLKYLHDREIVHRDLKCENILLTAAYNTTKYYSCEKAVTKFRKFKNIRSVVFVTLSNTSARKYKWVFGFARYYHPDKEPKSETFCGSVSYAAPEIIRGSAYDPRLSDLWSLGIILYIMLNKGMPFDDASLKKLYEAQITRDWKFRSKVKDKLSSEVKAFMYRLLEPQPDKRVQLEKMTEDPWFQNASQANIVVEPIYDQPVFQTTRTEDPVPVQDGDTGKEEYFQDQSTKMGAKHEDGPKTVWSKHENLGSSSTTVRTQGAQSSKSSRSTK